MVVVGLITCERVVLGKGAKVLIGGSAQGICPPHSWKMKLTGRRKDKVNKREDGEDGEENGVVEERAIRQTHQMTHEME